MTRGEGVVPVCLLRRKRERETERHSTGGCFKTNNRGKMDAASLSSSSLSVSFSYLVSVCTCSAAFHTGETKKERTKRTQRFVSWQQQQQAKKPNRRTTLPLNGHSHLELGTRIDRILGCQTHRQPSANELATHSETMHRQRGSGLWLTLLHSLFVLCVSGCWHN